MAYPHAGQYAGPFCVADGIEEVRRAVRLQIRRGATVIKVIASGGIMSRDDNPKYSQYSPEELRVIVGAYFPSTFDPLQSIPEALFHIFLSLS